MALYFSHCKIKLTQCTHVLAVMVEREKEADGPVCKNAEKLSENADSYLTEAHQQLARLLIRGWFRAVAGRQNTTFEEPKFWGHFDVEAGRGKDSTKTKDSPRHCKNEDGVEEKEEREPEPAVATYSYLSEARQQVSNTRQEGRLLITGQFKFIDHRDTPEHHYEFKDLTGQQLNDTFKEPNSFGYFYIEAGPITHN